MAPLIVRPYGRKTLVFACGSVILALCFGWVIVDAAAHDNVSFAYFLASVFGVSALFWVGVIFPGSTFVKAGVESIEVRFFWVRAFAFRWPEIERISASTGVVRIRLTHSGESKNRHTLFQRITGGRLGRERALPDLFSLSSSDLAHLLNDMRSKYRHAG